MEKKCLKPPTSHGFQDPEVRLDAWWLQNSKMPKISIWASSWCLAGSPVGSDDLGSSCRRKNASGRLAFWGISMFDVFRDCETIHWLVVYLWKIWVCQLGWLTIPNMMGKIIQSCSSHHQPVYQAGYLPPNRHPPRRHVDAQTEAPREGLHQPLRHVAALRQPLIGLADPRRRGAWRMAWRRNQGSRGGKGVPGNHQKHIWIYMMYVAQKIDWTHKKE